MNFLTNLNLNRNELQNAVIQPLAVAPSSPKAGQIYYNSGDKFIYRFDGDNWSPIGVVYIQGSTAGAVITGLDGTGKVTTTNVVGLQLAGYTPVEGGYVSNNMTMQQAFAALDEAIKNAVAGGGEVNQNAWSNITVPAQSTNVTNEVSGESSAVTISANAKTDTFTIASGDAWTKVDADKSNKKITLGHKFSGATNGTYGDATHVAKVTVDKAGHVTGVENVAITNPEYSIVKDATAQNGFIATYHLTKDGANVGTAINIPKDYLVKSAEVKVATGSDASGFPAGTTYIDFVVNTYDTTSGSGTESHIYLNVETLVKTHTAGNGISISDTNVISAKVVAANGLSVDANGIKMGVASTTANGAMTSNMVAKLNGIDNNATANTITFNGTQTKTPSFYAPVAAGSKGNILVSNGSGAPVWQSAPESFHKYTAQNATLSANSGAFTWNIASSVHGVTNSSMLVQLYEVATGAQVIADIVVNQTNFNIAITINDAAGAGTLSANTYKVVVIG